MELRKHLLRLWAPAAALIAHSGIWAFVWVVYYSGIVPRQIYWKGNLLVAVVYGTILFFFTNFYGGFRIGFYPASNMTLSGIIALVFTNVITWAQICLIGTAILNPTPILAMTVSQCVLTGLWAILTGRLYAHIVPPHRMLLIYGESEQARELACKLVTRSEKYNIQESIDIRGMDIEEIAARVLEYKAVVFRDLPPEMLGELQKLCFNHSIRAYIAPGIQDILIRGAEDMNLFDTPLLLSRNQGLDIERRIIKRLEDIMIAGLGLLLLSPIMLLVAIAVKICDGGRIIYSQERLTIGGKRFKLYKFRSMSAGAEKNGARLSTKNDNRVTPVGKIIRAAHLDETPQLYNVIKGDMSIVGPRPERPEIAARYLEIMPEFNYRLKVKAGLTGYAQVYGNYNTAPQDKLKLDLIYIINHSPALDYKVMLMTAKTLFQKERSQGIADGMTIAVTETGENE